MPRSIQKPSSAPREPRGRQAVPPAEVFRRSRRDRAAETAQDYVEAIADLTASQGEARMTELARRLGVTHVTVNRTLARLKKIGLVNMEPYRAIFLTDTGRKLAEESKQRHETVLAFLQSLGIPECVAEMDAEGIEHHVSPVTLAAFKTALRKTRHRQAEAAHKA